MGENDRGFFSFETKNSVQNDRRKDVVFCQTNSCCFLKDFKKMNNWLARQNIDYVRDEIWNGSLSYA